MMPISCECLGTLLSDYLAGEASPEEVQAVEAHLQSCEACRELARDLVWQDLDLAGMAAGERVPEMLERLGRALPRGAAASRRAQWRLFGRHSERPSFLVPVLAAAGFFAAIILTVAVWNRPAPEDRPSAVSLPAGAAGGEESAAERRRSLEDDRRRAGEAIQRFEEEGRRVQEARRRAADERREEDRLRAEAEMPRIEVERRRAEMELKLIEKELAQGPVAPAPEPRPEPPSAPAPGPATRATVARLKEARGGAFLLAGEERSPARTGQDLLPGQGIEASGPAVVEFADGTRLDLEAGTTFRDLEDRAGKSLFVERGALRAEVVRQPPGRPMTFLTAHGRATVIGTRLRLEVDADWTCLEVAEGKVRLENLAGRSVDIPAGHYAVAAAGADLSPRPLPKLVFSEDFEDARAVASRWMSIRGGFPITLAGRLEVDVSPRPSDPYRDSWHVGGGLQARVPARVPFRVSVDVEVSHRHSNLIAALLFIPAQETPPGGDEASRLWVSFRGDVLAIMRGDTVASSPRTFPGAWPRRARWTVEYDPGEIRVSVDGGEAARLVHGRRDTACFVRLEGNAKRDVPAGARVAFDNIRVEELSR